MDTLRRRIPFKLPDDDEHENDGILDEQQQEAIVEHLRKANDIVNRRYASALKCLLGLSCVLQLVMIKRNSLLNGPIAREDPSIPLPAFFTVLSLFIHLNLILHFYTEDIRVGFQLSESLSPLSYQLLYSLSAVAPTLSLFLQKPWQTTVWWSLTIMIIFVVQTVLDAMQQSVQGIADLDNMKYIAPGA